jgi:hypothetical protein
MAFDVGSQRQPDGVAGTIYPVILTEPLAFLEKRVVG